MVFDGLHIAFFHYGGFMKTLACPGFFLFALLLAGCITNESTVTTEPLTRDEPTRSDTSLVRLDSQVVRPDSPVVQIDSPLVGELDSSMFMKPHVGDSWVYDYGSSSSYQGSAGTGQNGTLFLTLRDLEVRGDTSRLTFSARDTGSERYSEINPAKIFDTSYTSIYNMDTKGHIRLVSGPSLEVIPYGPKITEQNGRFLLTEQVWDARHYFLTSDDGTEAYMDGVGKIYEYYCHCFGTMGPSSSYELLRTFNGKPVDAEAWGKVAMAFRQALLRADYERSH
jgi:hypothetical protein